MVFFFFSLVLFVFTPLLIRFLTEITSDVRDVILELRKKNMLIEIFKFSNQVRAERVRESRILIAGMEIPRIR